MTLLRSYPSRDALDRPPSRAVDVVVFLAAAVLLGVIARVSSGVNVPFDATSAPSRVSTDPAQLPYYAARSLLRMFIALGLSLLFTFVYATAAARLRRAREGDAADPGHPAVGADPRVSVGDGHRRSSPCFRARCSGLECASIFAIFTSQAWNMTFGFYHSLVSQPRELDEAARMLRLTRWQRFWQRRCAQRHDPRWSGTA